MALDTKTFAALREQHLTATEKTEYFRAMQYGTPMSASTLAKITALRDGHPPNTSPKDTSPTTAVAVDTSPKGGRRTRHNPRSQQVKAGRARMAKLTAEERRASAKKAVEARWARVRRAS